MLISNAWIYIYEKHIEWDLINQTHSANWCEEKCRLYIYVFCSLCYISRPSRKSIQYTKKNASSTFLYRRKVNEGKAIFTFGRKKSRWFSNFWFWFEEGTHREVFFCSRPRTLEMHTEILGEFNWNIFLVFFMIKSARFTSLSRNTNQRPWWLGKWIFWCDETYRNRIDKVAEGAKEFL